MDRSAIEAEVRRLAPWYYSWDLCGVRTDATPPCDDQGHREVFCPPIHDGFWCGKSVLDVGCNEGAYGFGALEHGARRLVGFDCRAVNVEKARFIARLRSHDNAEFSVQSCDSWIRAHGDRLFDVVMMCGILYHLTDPQETIRQYCRIAREWICVTSCVVGSDEGGFTVTPEANNIAASDGGHDSLMPNGAMTLIGEFRKHGFEPVHVSETRRADFFDGVSLLLRNCNGLCSAPEPLDVDRDEVAVYAAPALAPGARSIELFGAMYNLLGRPHRVRARVSWRHRGGRDETIAQEVLDLAPRSLKPGDPDSASTDRRLALTGEGDGVEIEIRDVKDGALVGGVHLPLVRPRS
ncbi:MAG TPA: methyltransferase domain-containing protein [Planctomycetota bacterium]|nr:methyltransferase domain-containing protein [Planctomycetota bacterium]